MGTVFIAVLIVAVLAFCIYAYRQHRAAEQKTRPFEREVEDIMSCLDENQKRLVAEGEKKPVGGNGKGKDGKDK